MSKIVIYNKDASFLKILFFSIFLFINKKNIKGFHNIFFILGLNNKKINKFARKKFLNSLFLFPIIVFIYKILGRFFCFFNFDYKFLDFNKLFFNRMLLCLNILNNSFKNKMFNNLSNKNFFDNFYLNFIKHLYFLSFFYFDKYADSNVFFKNRVSLRKVLFFILFFFKFSLFSEKINIFNFINLNKIKSEHSFILSCSLKLLKHYTYNYNLRKNNFFFKRKKKFKFLKKFKLLKKYINIFNQFKKKNIYIKNFKYINIFNKLKIKHPQVIMHYSDLFRKPLLNFRLKFFDFFFFQRIYFFENEVFFIFSKLLSKLITKGFFFKSERIIKNFFILLKQQKINFFLLSNFFMKAVLPSCGIRVFKGTKGSKEVFFPIILNKNKAVSIVSDWIKEGILKKKLRNIYDSLFLEITETLSGKSFVYSKYISLLSAILDSKQYIRKRRIKKDLNFRYKKKIKNLNIFKLKKEDIYSKNLMSNNNFLYLLNAQKFRSYISSFNKYNANKDFLFFINENTEESNQIYYVSFKSLFFSLRFSKFLKSIFFINILILKKLDLIKFNFDNLVFNKNIWKEYINQFFTLKQDNQNKTIDSFNFDNLNIDFYKKNIFNRIDIYFKLIYEIFHYFIKYKSISNFFFLKKYNNFLIKNKLKIKKKKILLVLKRYNILNFYENSFNFILLKKKVMKNLFNKLNINKKKFNYKKMNLNILFIKKILLFLKNNKNNKYNKYKNTNFVVKSNKKKINKKIKINNLKQKNYDSFDNIYIRRLLFILDKIKFIENSIGIMFDDNIDNNSFVRLLGRFYLFFFLNDLKSEKDSFDFLFMDNFNLNSIFSEFVNKYKKGKHTYDSNFHYSPLDIKREITNFPLNFLIDYQKSKELSFNYNLTKLVKEDHRKLLYSLSSDFSSVNFSDLNLELDFFKELNHNTTITEYIYLNFIGTEKSFYNHQLNNIKKESKMFYIKFLRSKKRKKIYRRPKFFFSLANLGVFFRKYFKFNRELLQFFNIRSNIKNSFIFFILKYRFLFLRKRIRKRFLILSFFPKLLKSKNYIRRRIKFQR